MRVTVTDGPLQFEGAKDFRLRVVLAVLARRPVVIERIRSKDESPGVRDYEASLLHMLDKMTSGSKTDINTTGTRLRFKPGVLLGGLIAHDCTTNRGIGYWLEALMLLAPFCKNPVKAVLTGVTNEALDVSVDRLRAVAMPLIKAFGIDGARLDCKRRGAQPRGGGMVTFSCPVVKELRAVSILEEGFIRRVRGVAYSARVSPQVGNRVVASARSLLNKLLPDVYINTDHMKGVDAGLSPGYALSLVAESTSGCLASAEAPVRPGETPEELGRRVSALLCDELSRGGCVDTDASPIALVFMALTPPDVSRLRIGRLSPRAVATLQLIDKILGVRFRLRPEPKGTIRQRAEAGVAADDEGARNLIAGKGMAPAAPKPADPDEELIKGKRKKRSRDD
ncbi:RCL1, partial [Symbiodinium sp. KB8]